MLPLAAKLSPLGLHVNVPPVRSTSRTIWAAPTESVTDPVNSTAGIDGQAVGLEGQCALAVREELGVAHRRIDREPDPSVGTEAESWAVPPSSVKVLVETVTALAPSVTVVVTPLAPAAGRKGTPEKVKAPVTVWATRSTVMGDASTP